MLFLLLNTVSLVLALRLTSAGKTESTFQVPEASVTAFAEVQLSVMNSSFLIAGNCRQAVSQPLHFILVSAILKIFKPQ